MEMEMESFNHQHQPLQSSSSFLGGMYIIYPNLRFNFSRKRKMGAHNSSIYIDIRILVFKDVTQSKKIISLIIHVTDNNKRHQK
jgi:hypothetical protein